MKTPGNNPEPTPEAFEIPNTGEFVRLDRFSHHIDLTLKNPKKNKLLTQKEIDNLIHVRNRLNNLDLSKALEPFDQKLVKGAQEVLTAINLRSQAQENREKKITIGVLTLIGALLITSAAAINKGTNSSDSFKKTTPPQQPTPLPQLPRSPISPSPVPVISPTPQETTQETAINVETVSNKYGKILYKKVMEYIGAKRTFIIKYEGRSQFATFVVTREENTIVQKRYMTTTMAGHGASFTIMYGDNTAHYPSERVRKILQQTGDKWAAVELAIVEILNEQNKTY